VLLHVCALARLPAVPKTLSLCGRVATVKPSFRPVLPNLVTFRVDFLSAGFLGRPIGVLTRRTSNCACCGCVSKAADCMRPEIDAPAVEIQETWAMASFCRQSNRGELVGKCSRFVVVRATAFSAKHEARILVTGRVSSCVRRILVAWCLCWCRPAV